MSTETTVTSSVEVKTNNTPISFGTIETKELNPLIGDAEFTERFLLIFLQETERRLESPPNLESQQNTLQDHSTEQKALLEAECEQQQAVRKEFELLKTSLQGKTLIMEEILETLAQQTFATLRADFDEKLLLAFHVVRGSILDTHGNG